MSQSGQRTDFTDLIIGKIERHQLGQSGKWRKVGNIVLRKI